MEYLIMVCIYGIFDNKTNDVYIGSTKNLKSRMSQHKRKSNTCSSKDIIQRNNYTVKILEESNNWNELTTRIKEQQYINKYQRIQTGGRWKKDKYNVVNRKDVISIPYCPNKIILKEEKERISRQNKETWRDFAVNKNWQLSWNEKYISLCRWTQEPLDEDNMYFIDCNLFIE